MTEIQKTRKGEVREDTIQYSERELKLCGKRVKEVRNKLSMPRKYMADPSSVGIDSYCLL